MDGLTPIVVAIIGTLGTLGVAALRYRRRANDGPSTARRWRDEYYLAKARADEEHEAREAALIRNRSLESQLRATQHDLDDCARQRAAAWAELDGVKRRRAPREPRRDSADGLSS